MLRDIGGRFPQANLKWQAREVLCDIEQRPHLVSRITLSGLRFPERSLAPFVRIGSALTAWVEIEKDEQGVRAYFRGELPPTGTVEFGYGNEVFVRFPRNFDRDKIMRLDRARLSEDTVVY